MKRKIISIDDEKCNGCGQFIPDCPEGALKVIDGKARLVVWFEHMASLSNSLGTCICSSHMFLVYGPTLMSALYSACTGWEITPRELMKTGERIYNLMKAYNVRAGLS